MWPSPSPALLSAALKLRTIAGDAAGLTREQFIASYGRGFFVVHASKRAVNTMSRTLATTDPAKHVHDTAAMDILVFPIVKRDAENPNPFVSIGRLPGNDVAINDETVSKFHAFVRETNGQFALQDARSRNGTSVDHVPVTARGVGEPTILRSGQTVRFATVATTFLDVDALLMFAKRFV